MNCAKVCFLILSMLLIVESAQAQDTNISGFKHWKVGSDSKTKILIPSDGQAIGVLNDTATAHVKYIVAQYGELSFPIDPKTLPDEEARRVDLSKSSFITITYKANHELVLQLRQTGVHGGIQNHVTLPQTKEYVTRRIALTDFKGGKSPLDLRDVAKFNFAFLSNGADGYAELFIKAFTIDRYTPQ